MRAAETELAAFPAVAVAPKGEVALTPAQAEWAASSAGQTPIELPEPLASLLAAVEPHPLAERVSIMWTRTG